MTADQPAPAEAPDEREAEYGVVNGWLVEYVNEHTCGTAKGGYYGAHEPGCGQVPIARVSDLLRRSPDDLLAEHRQEWASYIEHWSQAVGPEPPTVEGIVAALRLPSPPFGMVRAADAEGSGR